MSRIRLFPDQLSGFVFGGGGPCTALSPELRGGGLESQFGWGPGHPGQESDGLVLLVPWVQAVRVFSGYPAGGIDSRIAGRSGTACFVPSTVVRTEDERWKIEKGNLIAYHLLESSTGAYVEWLVNEPMRLLIKIDYKGTLLVMLPTYAINL